MKRSEQAKKVMNSLKDIVQKSKSEDLNNLRMVIALERAVARVEKHPKLSKHLIFKGGFVLLKTIETTRFTRDIDALALEISITQVPKLVEQALSMDLEDGLWFGDLQAEELHDQGSYGGYRFSCAFQIGDPPNDTVKIKKLSRINIDVGFGDPVEDLPKKQLMLSIISGSKPVSWSVYPFEYIFSEKLETLFSRGSANSRAKDVYDMPLIFPKCNLKKLVKAVRRTFEQRKTALPASFKETAAVFNLALLKRSWAGVEFNESRKNFDDSWNDLLDCLEKIDGSNDEEN